MTASKQLKIAAITDDGITISQHFGRAGKYLVATVEDDKIIARELRQKMGHAHSTDQPHHDELPGHQHGLDPASHNTHIQMSEVIADCEALLCGGMGKGAYESMKMRGILPVVTDIADIDEAVLAFAANRIVDRVDLLH